MGRFACLCGRELECVVTRRGRVSKRSTMPVGGQEYKQTDIFRLSIMQIRVVMK
jgi:hypothetical protein